jgi:colanic acid/amylovoran biosynthesis glycosyltransferase
MTEGLRLMVMTDAFPVLSETFVGTEVRELQRAGASVVVEAVARGDEGVDPGPSPVRYMTDERIGQKLADLAWLVARHPIGCLRDLRSRRRWSAEETVRPLRALAGRVRRAQRERIDHIHVHFAAEAALDALRIGRLAGIPYSVTAHAYDIFLRPANLAQKLDSAAFATTGCEYNAAHLRALVKDPARVHVIVMGVDTDRFRRRSEHGSTGTVLAVGRLVEKKGFDVLIDAMAAIHGGGRAVIVGDGPLESALRERVAAHGVNNVEFAGSRSPDGVRELLEQADLLAMPCVVAPDGDRDSMPVVCKEALAMEVPVVASDEVGLPELIRPGWGRLVEPGAPAPLAAAISELLALSPHDRRDMGRAGRAWVEEHCDAAVETGRLVELIAGGAGGRGARGLK